MKKSLITSILFLSSGIVLGSGGMYLVHVSITANDTSAETEIDIATSANQSSQGDYSESIGESNEYIVIDTDSVASIEDTSLHTDAFQRRLAIYTHVAGLSVQELTTELEAISSGSQKYPYLVTDQLQEALVERLAIVKPETAVKFAVAQKLPESDWITQWYGSPYPLREDEPPDMPVVRSVFSDWALSDLKSAIRGAKSLSTDAKSNALAGILASQAGQSLTTHRQIARELGDEERGVDSYVQVFSTGQIENPKAAWDEVIALLEPNNFRRSQPLLNIASEWFKKDGFNVLEEINQSAVDANIKTGVIQRLLWQAAEDNPEQAFQFALKMPSEGGFNSSLTRVVMTWSESDPQAALQAVNNIEQSGLRERLQYIPVRSWTSKEPRYVLENLDLFPTSLRDNVRRDAIRSIARDSPKEAAELVVEMTEDMMVSSIANDIMRAWVEQDVEAAVNWVYNGPGSEESQSSWVRALAVSLIKSDPRRAFDLAVKQELPEGSSFMGMGSYQPPGLEAEVIRQIARQDLDLAMELLPRVRDGITKTAAYSSVGELYIDEGQASKALELGLKLPPEDQLNFFEGIAYSWARIDPAGLVESIEQFPSEEIRSRVASVLSNRWIRDSFTEEQFNTLKQYLSDSDRKTLEDL